MSKSDNAVPRLGCTYGDAKAEGEGMLGNGDADTERELLRDAEADSDGEAVGDKEGRSVAVGMLAPAQGESVVMHAAPMGVVVHH